VSSTTAPRTILLPQTPAVSVIVSVRNGQPYLDAALASLARQSLDDFEVVVVDNGSTDGSAEIIAEWVGRDRRFRSSFVAQPGVSRALNHGVSLARGQFLARLDADDIALDDRLAIQFAIMRADPELALLGGYAILIDDHGRRVGERQHPTSDEALRASLPVGCPFVTSTVMMRRDVFDQVGGYREGLNLSEDYDLWCRISEVARLGNVDRALSRYRVHPQSATQRFEPRLWLTTTCVVAARDARRLLAAEPFVAGRPSLRRALPLLGVSREAYLREMRPRRLRHRLHRLYYSLPGPYGLKRAVHEALRGLGVNRPYSFILTSLAARSAKPSRPTVAREAERVPAIFAGEPVPSLPPG
jgi:glycosyltransferase involved in cell wall biosynthesis